MRKFIDNPNIDNSNPSAYPDGRIKDNTGAGNGTGVNERVYGDIYQAILKLKRLYGIIENNLPDNEVNGFQIIDALRGFASKNDYLLSITAVGPVLSVPVKLGFMKNNEIIICRAAVDIPADTTIKGNELSAATFNAALSDPILTNDFVILQKSNTTVFLYKIVVPANITPIVNALGYLKKASQAEEDAGLIDTVATTPKVNKTTFKKRVNGTLSTEYLVVPTGTTGAQPGLMTADDKFKLDNFESNVKNIGYITGVDVGSGTVGSTYTVGGDVVSATIQSNTSGRQVIRVVVSNSLITLNYFVRFSLQSLATSITTDTDLRSPVFRPIDPVTFDMAIGETDTVNQNIRVHIETVKI